MTHRPSQDTLESLRITLQKLEQTTFTGKEVKAMAALKSILLNRIADLEVATTLAPAETETAKTPAPADLVPPAPMAEGDLQKEAVDTTQLDKLD
jgi:hypothetical protein